MIKMIFVVACLILAFSGSSKSTNISCKYDIDTYSAVGRVYLCYIEYNPNILTEESAQITGISGWHKGSRTNDYVNGFDVRLKTVQIFPKGLEKFFKNIQLIIIYECGLKEIHQTDLKVFPDLANFWLDGNKIKVIEEGLFDFNSKLEFLAILESKIIHIDPNVFDNLVNLSSFWFTDVPCVAQRIDKSKEKVQQAIKVVKSQCTNSEFLSLNAQIKTLETESKTLNLADFKTKLETFEKSFNASKFSKFRPLNYKFQNLKSIA